jgi:hypothetical protein
MVCARCQSENPGFFDLALAEVHRYEGTINHFLGDGFMALLGAPVAHEDHARRAVLAALGIRRRVAERDSGLSPVSGWGSTPAPWWWARSAKTCGWTTRR